jgi:hypothetical protein
MAIMLDNATDPQGLRSMLHLSRVTFRRLPAGDLEAAATSSVPVDPPRGKQGMLVCVFGAGRGVLWLLPGAEGGVLGSD